MFYFNVKNVNYFYGKTRGHYQHSVDRFGEFQMLEV